MNAESNSASLPPTFSELLDYAEGRLAGVEHQRVAEFIAEHPHEVKADWAWVQDFLRKSQSVQLHPMPAGLEDRLISLHTANPAVPALEKISGWVDSIRRVVAELVDPGIAPGFAAAGLRTKSFEQTGQQWIFKTAEFDILVNALERPDQRYDLHGQVLATTEGAMSNTCSAQLLREDREFGLTSIDAYGEFVIQGVPPGEYALVIAGEKIEVVCSPVSFGT
jgi:hypothetical protein